MIGLTYFLSEKMPYADVKIQLKYALARGKNSSQLKAVILHNLAVINYCEMTDHNDRIINGDNPEHDNNMLEQIKKVEDAKKKTKADALKVREEVDEESRKKRYKER